MSGRLLVLAVAVVVAGCAGVPRGPEHVRVPPGSELQLAGEPQANANGFLYFQNGSLVEFPNRMRAPWCRLRSGGAGAVPARWTVTGFDVREWDSGAIIPGPGFHTDNETALIDYRSIMALEAVEGRTGELRCTAREREWLPPAWLTPEEINAVLGDAGRLRLP